MEEYKLTVSDIQQIIEWFTDKKISAPRIKGYFSTKKGKLTGE